MLKSFNDGNFILDNQPAGVNKHNFDRQGNGVTVSTEKRAKLGDRLPNGKASTNLIEVRGIIHEAAHSVSQKFDLNYLNSNETKQKILRNEPIERDMSIGEIESKFIEKVFDDFALSHSEDFEKTGNSFENVDSLQEEIRELEKYDTMDFLEGLTKGMREGDPDYKQSGAHRYVIGTVLASLLFEDYKKDPEGTLELFNEYLENQCSMDINDATKFLTKGKAQHFGQAVYI